MSESYVIIGDGIAGSSAAETIREEKPDADIAVITDEGEALYNRILIKEFAKGKLPEAPISIHEPEWYDERDIDLELNTFVTDIDPDAHEVHTHASGIYTYDKLLVATGGTPTQLPVDNSDADGIHHFWTFQDARRIAEHAEASDTGTVIGAGLLGIDLAAICAAQDVEAKYIMRGNRWWRYGLSLDGAEIIHDALEEKGVEPVLESGVNGFKTDDDGNVVATIDADDNEYESDFVGIAIGLNFNTEYLQGSGVETDNGVVVDQYMQTNVDDIYAAGDITRFYDVILDEYAQNGSWGSAKQQGVIAAKNMVADDEEEEFRWVSSYSITHFDFPFLSFGFPTMGDDECEEKYSETEWRRLSFKDGKLIGGVLIGDIAPQGKYKDLIRNEVECADQKEILLEKDFDPDKLAPQQEQ
ncbi:FAD-dependent pyridine nucleotide-disulfide oxidoreductase [Haladaptatus paucihalophilus DX253]|uniref:FAD-dependent pyridine nucleotide-disulfide oxidoreductase n=1 Tax=Haladaptatus paucihalophilus DX253 TaxID=797209 RepID=E7QNN0_HALPU|nr:FAD-dependent oxidoreductase [Haladaptatus paucihalophilus]EFW94147.1 FAD-dependent pyridine nucleotide-disulfide oxidoreductase [Haladaptatus paucihalophilus DX253]SHK60301.1 Pyridine nucleotide-disulphide oxidoreductase [Haladaptatus paucihalophilus DX253]